MSPNPPTTRVGNALSVTQPGERQLFTIKRHPIGVLGVYVVSGVILIITAILTFAVAPSVITSVSNRQVVLIGGLVFLLVAVVAAAFGFIATMVYWGNSWILTSDSITQVSQTSLFDRQSSQLSLESLEDITAEQNGIFPHLFNYGTLRVETAGHSSKFVFPYCPNPNYYAQQILAAREAFAQAEHHMQEPGPPVSQSVPQNSPPYS